METELDENGTKWQVRGLGHSDFNACFQRLADRAEEEVQKRIKEAVEKFKAEAIRVVQGYEHLMEYPSLCRNMVRHLESL